jgi:predicted enzyme related to lactoylglutathione lyase
MGEVVGGYPHGTFCWVDLGTPEVARAKAFYGGLFGWELEDLPADGGSETICRLGGRDVAGIHRRDAAEGVGWTSAIAVDGLERTTARAGELGATVVAGPAQVGHAGRRAVLADPTGAVVSLWQAGSHAGAALVNEVGTWTWNELVTADLDGAAAFYAALLGWQAERLPGPLQRCSFSLGDLLVGGAHAPTPQEGDQARWTVSFRVADADQSVARARELGGTVLLPPMDIPIGRFAILADPAGAPFTVTAFPGGARRGVDGS